MIKKIPRLVVLVCSLLPLPVALAHPGHEHAQGWLSRVAHAPIGWDQLLLLIAVAMVAVYLFIAKNRR